MTIAPSSARARASSAVRPTEAPLRMAATCLMVSGSSGESADQPSALNTSDNTSGQPGG